MPKKLKLKNCPFCGEEAHIIQRKNKMWDIGCDNLWCFAWICLDKNCECQDGYVNKKDGIDAWNTRTN